MQPDVKRVDFGKQNSFRLPILAPNRPNAAQSDPRLRGQKLFRVIAPTTATLPQGVA